MSGALGKRIRELESKLAVGSVIVLLNDGNRVNVRKCDFLDVLLGAFARVHAANEGQPFPVNPLDGVLDALSKAEPVNSPEPLIEIAADALRARPVLASDVPAEDAPPTTATIHEEENDAS